MKKKAANVQKEGRRRKIRRIRPQVRERSKAAVDKKLGLSDQK